MTAYPAYSDRATLREKRIDYSGPSAARNEMLDVVARFDPRKYEREVRAAQQKAQREYNRQVDAYNRKAKAHNQSEENRVKREIDAYNRKAKAHNQRVNREIDTHNRKAKAHNKQVIDNLNRQLRTASTGPRYTPTEEVLADRVVQALPGRDEREWDSFLSYARIDGAEAGTELRDALSELGVSVWFDEVTITPGKSQSLQMDKGLQRARAGIALLTPAYLAGRFWTERELGALLGKETLIPVLHNVTFDEVKEYSGILPDLAGFETSRDSISVIAEKIAAALLSDG